MADTAFHKQAAPVEPTHENGARRLAPAVDIYESGEGFLILADLPGVEPDELTIEYNPPELHVLARPKVNGALVYERRFELGSGVDASSISAELKDGVLRIELKKAAELRPRRISVRAA